MLVSYIIIHYIVIIVLYYYLFLKLRNFLYIIGTLNKLTLNNKF